MNDALDNELRINDSGAVLLPPFDRRRLCVCRNNQEPRLRRYAEICLASSKRIQHVALLPLGVEKYHVLIWLVELAHCCGRHAGALLHALALGCLLLLRSSGCW
ncbi:hypothetical protein GQ54DRAFT_100144 [Martensiomyces pterosporus]|nr:hypothetical protein GQ54DRAFT_100144 [Martensiomyces pterosporus]